MKRALALLSLVLLAVVPFLGGLRGDFIEDDVGAIRDRVELRADGDLWGVWADNYWGDLWGGLYRPLTVFSWGVDRVVFGARDLEREGDGLGPPAPWGVHLSNLLWNAGCALVLFLLLERLYGARRFPLLAPWFGAAVFAVHPAHVEAVVHMVGRADLLATFFFLAAWVAHGAPERARGLRPWLGAALYLLSLLAKESGALLPAVLLGEAALRAPWRGAGAWIRSQVPALLPYAVALAAFVAVRGVVLGGEMDPPRAWMLYSAGVSVGFPDPAPLEVPLTMTHALGEYLRLFVAPVWLSADYSGFPHATGPTAPVIASGLVLAALVALAVRAARRGEREPLAWISVLLWTYLPVSNLIFVTGIVMAERAFYLPSIALCGLVAWGAGRLFARRAWIVAGGVALALLTVRTALRAPVWKDAGTLFEETVASGRYAGHLALTGAVDARVQAMAADAAKRAELLPETLAMAQRSVEEHRTRLNVTHLAWLLEQDGQLLEALRRWSQVEAAEPARRGDVLTCVTRIAARTEDRELLRDAVGVAGETFDRAQAAGDAARAAFWRDVLQRLLVPWVEAAAAREDWVFAAAGRGLLARVNPSHPLLPRMQVPVLEGAIRAYLAAGRAAEARALAQELAGVAPGNGLAREVLAE